MYRISFDENLIQPIGDIGIRKLYGSSPVDGKSNLNQAKCVKMISRGVLYFTLVYRLQPIS